MTWIPYALPLYALHSLDAVLPVVAGCVVIWLRCRLRCSHVYAFYTVMRFAHTLPRCTFTYHTCHIYSRVGWLVTCHVYLPFVVRSHVYAHDFTGSGYAHRFAFYILVGLHFGYLPVAILHCRRTFAVTAHTHARWLPATVVTPRLRPAVPFSSFLRFCLPTTFCGLLHAQLPAFVLRLPYHTVAVAGYRTHVTRFTVRSALRALYGYRVTAHGYAHATTRTVRTPATRTYLLRTRVRLLRFRVYAVLRLRLRLPLWLLPICHTFAAFTFFVTVGLPVLTYGYLVAIYTLRCYHRCCCYLTGFTAVGLPFTVRLYVRATVRCRADTPFATWFVAGCGLDFGLVPRTFLHGLITRLLPAVTALRTVPIRGCGLHTPVAYVLLPRIPLHGCYTVPRYIYVTYPQLPRLLRYTTCTFTHGYAPLRCGWILPLLLRLRTVATVLPAARVWILYRFTVILVLLHGLPAYRCRLVSRSFTRGCAVGLPVHVTCVWFGYRFAATFLPRYYVPRATTHGSAFAVGSVTLPWLPFWFTHRSSGCGSTTFVAHGYRLYRTHTPVIHTVPFCRCIATTHAVLDYRLPRSGYYTHYVRSRVICGCSRLRLRSVIRFCGCSFFTPVHTLPVTVTTPHLLHAGSAVGYVPHVAPVTVLPVPVLYLCRFAVTDWLDLDWLRSTLRGSLPFCHTLHVPVTAVPGSLPLLRHPAFCGYGSPPRYFGYVPVIYALHVPTRLYHLRSLHFTVATRYHAVTFAHTV